MESKSGEYADAGHAQERAIPSIVHRGAGVAAILIILAFQCGTIIAELAFDRAAIAAVKTAIWYSIPVLVLSMATAGGSGTWLARSNASTVVKRKRRRMALATANGVLILIPCAYGLRRWSAAGDLGAGFYTVQALELAAGLTNLVLLIRNALDGRKLTARRRTRRPLGTIAAPD